MYICPITKDPERLTAQATRRYHFALAQWCRDDPRYCEHYKLLRQQGRVVILDNGQWEGEMVPMSKLAELVDAMKPTIVVAPDFMNRPVETRYVAQAFEAICHPSAAIMYVCHAIKPHGPMADYLDEVRYAADNYNVIGIPRCLPSRGAWLPAIADAAGDKPIHFLGLRMDEIDDLNSSFIEHVTSIDSAKFSDGRANGN